MREKTHAHSSPPSSLFLLTHPHPPHAPWWRQSHPSVTEIYTAGSRAKFWVFPFSISSSSFSLSSSSSLDWQGKKWGQGQSDSTPCMTGQHSLCPPSHTVKYIDVGTWPGPGERKKEWKKERTRERERLSSLSASLSSSPSLYLSSFSFCVTVEFEIPLNTACLIIRRRGGRIEGRERGYGGVRVRGLKNQKLESCQAKMEARWQFNHHMFRLDRLFFIS